MRSLRKSASDIKIFAATPLDDSHLPDCSEPRVSRLAGEGRFVKRKEPKECFDWMHRGLRLPAFVTFDDSISKKDD